MPTHKKKATQHSSGKSRTVPIYVRPHLGGSTAWGETHCEGMYTCAGAGNIFKVGDRSIIGFWGPKTCPGTTTLGDGSVWNLIPLTCKCE